MRIDGRPAIRWVGRGPPAARSVAQPARTARDCSAAIPHTPGDSDTSTTRRMTSGRRCPAPGPPGSATGPSPRAVAASPGADPRARGRAPRGQGRGVLQPGRQRPPDEVREGAPGGLRGSPESSREPGRQPQRAHLHLLGNSFQDGAEPPAAALLDGVRPAEAPSEGRAPTALHPAPCRRRCTELGLRPGLHELGIHGR